MQLVERQVASHNEALHGTNHAPGLLERTRTIERSRLLFWLLVGNMAVMIGNALLQLLGVR